MKRFRKFSKNPFNWFIVVLITLNILPILAPIFRYWGWEWAAKPIYFIYSFTCHQFAHRSLHIHDHQCAWCTRDMAIWGSMLVVALIVRKYDLRRGIKWYWVLPFLLPIALDGGIQTIATMLGIDPYGASNGAIYISNNFLRAITGAIFGTGLALWLMPNINAGFAKGPRVLKASNWSLRHTALASIVGIVIAYVGMVALWAQTSPNYPPENLLDFQVKTPVNQEFFVRREHGSCPANALSDPLALDCFFH